jgi:hypothetical protein
MSDYVECPKCRRLNFDFEASRICPACKWVIRPTPVEKVFGCDVLVEVRIAGGRSELQEKHYKGQPAQARTNAMNRSGAMRVLSIIPLSEEDYIRAYGDPSMKGER